MTDGIDQIRVRVSPDGRVNRNDAAAYLGRKPKTLAMWAVEGRGPPPVRCGGRIFYTLSSLEEFVRNDTAAFPRERIAA
jgi:hypothetical protein